MESKKSSSSLRAAERQVSRDSTKDKISDDRESGGRRETNKARQKRKERQREQVRKLEQKQRERDSTPVVDEPREIEGLVGSGVGGVRAPYHHKSPEPVRAPMYHQRDKPPEPDLPEPIDMFADDDNTVNVFRKRLSSPPRPVEPVQNPVDPGAAGQDLLALTGDGDRTGQGNKNVRFEMAGRPEPVSPNTPPSPGNTPLSDEDDGPNASNAPLLPVIETQLKPSPVIPVAVPAPYARVPGFSGVPPPSQNGMPPEPSDLPSAVQMPKSITSVPPPPLPPNALQEMHQISQLLNATTKLAAPGSSRPRGGTSDAFKAPLPFGSGTTSSSNDRKQHRLAGAFDNIDITDMDVASPTSDDDLIGSFTPPSSFTDDKRKKRHSERKRKAGSGGATSSGAAGSGKPFPTLNVEALARTIAELNKDDDVPVGTSAVELDKQRKVSQHVCTQHTFASLSVCYSVMDNFFLILLF